MLTLYAENQKPVKLAVTWETVPDPDSYALLKAVAIVFRRIVPGTRSAVTPVGSLALSRTPVIAPIRWSSFRPSIIAGSTLSKVSSILTIRPRLDGPLGDSEQDHSAVKIGSTNF
jgi:hypothetical protein